MEPSESRHRRGHVIVCGLRGIGLRIVEQFHLSDTDVVVLDDLTGTTFDRQLATWGVTHVHTNARVGDGLIEAGIEGALAVVCVEVDDVHTLETALRVHELRPDIRIVVQLANPSVAGALGRVTGPGTVLDSAALAAPSFVEACLQRPVHDVELAGVEFFVVQTDVPDVPERHETFRAHFGDLAPVAVMPGDGGPLVQCPGRDHPVTYGDRVAVLGTREELQHYGVDVDGPTRPPQRRVGLVRRVSRQVRTALDEGNQALAFVAVGLVALIVVSTVILRIGYRLRDPHEHLTILSSIYFTIETVATVGFGDYSFATQSAWMKLFGIILIAAGVALLSTAFALFTNLLVSRRIEQSLGRLEVPGMVDHVVVIGLGSVGISVVRGLIAEGQRVVVVERDPANRYLAQARALGVPVLVADATQRQTHGMVNLHDAAAVAVLTSADLTNIETALAIRESLGDRWETVPVTVRVFDRELARMMEEKFGFRYVRSTSALAAPWFVGAALGLDILSTFYVGQQPFLVGKVAVAADGGLRGLAMADLSARTRVIALRRSDADAKLEHPPRRGTRFAGGDEAYVLGPYEEILRVLHHERTVRNEEPLLD
jgi:Trk K+ transport system NAD-binding subunit